MPSPLDPTDRLVLLRWNDPDAGARAADYRARHKHPDEMCGPGNRPGSWQALGRINRVLVACGVCGALAAYPRVLRTAKTARRTTIAPFDGCAAPCCSRSRWHKAHRHGAQQQRWAAELRAGSLSLAERPAAAAQPTAPRVSGAALDAALAVVLARVVR